LANIDNLEIKISAQAKTASNAIDNLCNKLGRLSASLGSVNTGSITGMANGVNRLASAMTNMKSVGTADFTRAAKGIEKMSAVNTAALNRAASSIGQIGKSLNTLSGMGAASKNLADLATGIKQLGYTSSTKAIENIPKLATAMKQLMTELSKAPRVSQNLIDMTNALAKLSRTGSSAGKAANSLKSSLTSYSGSVKSSKLSTFSLASAIGRLYASYWMVIRAAGKLKDAVNLASDLTEVQNVVDTTFGAMTGKVEEYAKKSIETLGMSELSFKTYASQFQAMGSAMGIGTSQIAKANDFLQKTTDGYVGASDSLADVSLNLTKLAGDMASFYNKDQAEVAEDLRSVFTGMVVPLRQYGLDLTQATLKEWAMKNGMDADIESMSQAEKTMLRYQYVLANTTAAQGDFSRTADTWANQVRMLRENFKRLGAVIGQPIINALKPMVKALNAALMAVTQFAEKVSAALGKIFGWEYESGSAGIAVDLGNASDSAGDLADSTGDASKNTDKANKSAKQLKKTLSTLPFDQLNKLSDNSDSSGSGSGGSGGTGGGSGSNQGTWKRVTTMFESNIDNLYDLGRYISDTLSKAMESINWDSVYQKARNFGTGLADFLNGLISPRLFYNVGKTISNSLNTAIYAALAFGTTFDWTNLGLSIAAGINGFFRNFDFKALATTINTFVQGVWNTLVTAIQNVDWKSVWNGIKDFITTIDLKTIAIIIGAVEIKKIASFIIGKDILKSIGVYISQKIAAAIATNFGLEVAANATLSTVIGTGIKTLFTNAISYAGIGKLLSSLFPSSTLIQTITTTMAETGATLPKVLSGVIFTPIKEFFTLTLIPGITGLFASVGTSIGLSGTAAVVAGGGIIIAAIVATIAAIVAIVKNWDKIKEFFKELPGKIAGFFSELPGKIGYELGLINGKILKFAIDAVKTVITEVPKIISKIIDFFKELPGKIADFFREIPGKIQALDIPNKMLEIGKNIIQGLIDGFTGMIENVWTAITDFISGFVDGFKNGLGIHSPSTVFADIGKNILEGLLGGLGEKITDVLTWFGDLPGKIKDKLGDAKEWIKDKGQNALEGLRTGWDSVKESKVGQAAQKIGSYVKEKAGNATQWIKSKGSDAISGLRAGWESVKENGFLNTVSKIGKQTFDKIGNILNVVSPKGADIVSGLKNGFNNGIHTFYDLISGIPGKIRSGMGNLSAIGKEAIQGFVNGLTSVKIKLPHIEWTKTDIGIGDAKFSIPKFNINWYKTGGYFTKASMIGVGEAGDEAVLPLENRKTMSMIADSIMKNSSGIGISEEQMQDAVERGVAMALMNNRQDVNVQCVAEFKTTDEALARAVSRGQQKIEYRMKPVPSY
jgi:phage-related protein